MSTKQSIPSDDLSFDSDELAEVGAVLAPTGSFDNEVADSNSSKTPPQPMMSFDDQVDAAFSEEETAEKQPSVQEDFDGQASLDDLVDAAATQESIEPVAVSSVEESEPTQEGGPQTKATSGEIDDPTPPAMPMDSMSLPSVIFDETPFSEDAPASHDDGSLISPHVAAVAAAMDEHDEPVEDGVLSSSPSPNVHTLPVSVQNEAVGSAKRLPSSRVSRPEPVVSADSPEATDEHDDLFSEPVSPSRATPVVHLDEAEFHLVEDGDDPNGLASGKTPVASVQPAPSATAPIASSPPIDEKAHWLATSAATPPAAVDQESGSSESAWQSADSGPITTVSVDEIDTNFSDAATSDEVRAPAPLPAASQVSPSSDTKRTTGGSVPAIPPPPPKIAPPPPPPPAATRTPAPPPPPASYAKPVAPMAPQPSSKALSVPPLSGLLGFGEEGKLKKKKRGKQWFEEIFDEDYLLTLPFLTPTQTEQEVEFLLSALNLPAGARLLDLGCGYGRHSMELAARGYHAVGLDLSLPLLIRANEAARRAGVNVDFVHGDMRDMAFDGEFDGAFCFFTTFGYFDDETNRKVAASVGRSLKTGGRFVLDLINRDCLIGDLPTRVWWQGHGCMVLEEVDFNYVTSRLEVQRQLVLEDGRQLVQDISIRLYSLHEIGKILTHAGFRILEVSGNYALRNRFYGTESRQILIVAEKKPPEAVA